ncbi:MAG TPA: S8 family serine peptidase [Polyangiaceae bacterium]|nr:S8 family serine peptidase [Polyangiaceae bacterium]
MKDDYLPGAALSDGCTPVAREGFQASPDTHLLQGAHRVVNSPTPIDPIAEATFLTSVEHVSSLPLRAGGAAPTPVQVAVIDSAGFRQDNGQLGDDRTPHDRTIANIIERLACPTREGASACVVEIQNRLASRLARAPIGSVRSPGNVVGSQGDLAQAIVDAVDAAFPGRRLVINLSLGWTRYWGGAEGNESEFSPPVRAVWDALAYARCKGALIVAASGNGQGRPSLPFGPRYPAAWSERPAPSSARCERLGAGSGLPSATGPLLFAAGGVDNEDRALFNAPIGSRPALAAAASHAGVHSPATSRAAGPYTGTSIAAAVATSAAAVVWAYRPELSADEVMREVYSSSVSLGVEADFCFGERPCPEIRRVSICAAAQAACNAAAACATAPECVNSNAARSSFQALRDDSIAVQRMAASLSQNGIPAAGRGLDRRANDAWGLPLGEPQPEEPICTTCQLAHPQWTVGFRTNPPTAYNYFMQGVFLWDTLGGLWVDTSSNPQLSFSGAATLVSQVDLSWMAPPVYWAEVDIAHWENTCTEGDYLVVQTEPLQLVFPAPSQGPYPFW